MIVYQFKGGYQRDTKELLSQKRSSLIRVDDDFIWTFMLVLHLCEPRFLHSHSVFIADNATGLLHVGFFNVMKY